MIITMIDNNRKRGFRFTEKHPYNTTIEFNTLILIAITTFAMAIYVLTTTAIIVIIVN